MSTNGETADMVVRESIQITESAVKLAGLGAKNLAALLVAVAKDNPKLSGKTGLKRLIQDGEELAIFSVKQEDLRGFQMESKRYGVLFYRNQVNAFLERIFQVAVHSGKREETLDVCPRGVDQKVYVTGFGRRATGIGTEQILW